MTSRRSPRPLRWLGALLVIYLGYPVGAFIYRVAIGHNEGWNVPGLWSSLLVSTVGATISVGIGVLTGIPLAYVLARRRGWLAAAVNVVVQLPLAVPPLISGILLIYIVGPYTFLGRLSGERLTETLYGLVIAQSFVSLPFLVVVARSAFRAVDPSLDDVSATLGHSPIGRFLRVDVPAAADGLRTGTVLMWLRAFGEYGTTVVLAYHPYSLPVYVDNLFSSAPLSQAEAPTVLAFAVAVAVVALGRIRRPAPVRHLQIPAALPPVPTLPTPVGFDLDVAIGTFRLRVAHPERAHRLAVVGPSGSGKSITLRALAGLLGPEAGRVTYSGVDVSRLAPERRRIGYVPQGFGLIPGRTVWQQAVFGVHADPARAAWWLETLHLESLLDRYPDQLSGGQRQRVSLARALAGGPQLVLLDEPFSALDAPVRAELRWEMRRLQRENNLSTVLVTHDPEEAAMLADEIVVITAGQVLQAGRCRDVFARPASFQVARLLGIDNLASGVIGAGGELLTSIGPLRIGIDLPAGERVFWHVRPDRVQVLVPDTNGSARATTGDGNTESVDLGRGVVGDIVELGQVFEVVVVLGGDLTIRARTSEPVAVAVGEPCNVCAPAGAISAWKALQPDTSPPPSVVLGAAGDKEA